MYQEGRRRTLFFLLISALVRTPSSPCVSAVTAVTDIGVTMCNLVTQCVTDLSVARGGGGSPLPGHPGRRRSVRMSNEPHLRSFVGETFTQSVLSQARTGGTLTGAERRAAMADRRHVRAQVRSGPYRDKLQSKSKSGRQNRHPVD